MKFRKTEMVFSWKTFLVFLCTVISEIISVILPSFTKMHWFNLLLKWLSFSADACVLCSLLIKYRVSLRNIRLQKQNACKCNFIWTLTTLHAADVEIKATVLCLPVKHHQYWLSKYQFHFLCENKGLNKLSWAARTQLPWRKWRLLLSSCDFYPVSDVLLSCPTLLGADREAPLMHLKSCPAVLHKSENDSMPFASILQAFVMYMERWCTKQHIQYALEILKRSQSVSILNKVLCFKALSALCQLNQWNTRQWI